MPEDLLRLTGLSQEESAQSGLPTKTERKFDLENLPPRVVTKRMRRQFSIWRIPFERLDSFVDPVRGNRSLIHSSNGSRNVVAAKATSRDLAAAMGIPEEEAWAILEALGIVCLTRLQDGKGFAIPFVGTAKVEFKEDATYYNPASYFDENEPKYKQFPIHVRIRFSFLRGIRAMVQKTGIRRRMTDKERHQADRIEATTKKPHRGLGSFLASRRKLKKVVDHEQTDGDS